MFNLVVVIGLVVVHRVEGQGIKAEVVDDGAFASFIDPIDPKIVDIIYPISSRGDQSDDGASPPELGILQEFELVGGSQEAGDPKAQGGDQYIERPRKLEKM